MHFLNNFFVQYTVIFLLEIVMNSFKMCIHYAQVVKSDSNLTV